MVLKIASELKKDGSTSEDDVVKRGNARRWYRLLTFRTSPHLWGPTSYLKDQPRGESEKLNKTNTLFNPLKRKTISDVVTIKITHTSQTYYNSTFEKYLVPTSTFKFTFRSAIVPRYPNASRKEKKTLFRGIKEDTERIFRSIKQYTLNCAKNHYKCIFKKYIYITYIYK